MTMGNGITMGTEINQRSILQYVFGLIVLVLVGLIFIYFPLNIYPAEDAVMLFRYSESLSHTGTITYNLNDSPVEGATDFLWMIAIAFLNFLGANTFLSSTILSMIALVGTAYLLYKFTKQQNIYYFLFIILFLLLLPTTPASILGYSPLFYGFFIILSTYYFLENKLTHLLFSAFLLCLVRPDGVVFAVPIIVSFILFNLEGLRSHIKKVFLYFIFPGVVYFSWRWNYFGEFLPLSFYVRSTFDRFLMFFNEESLHANVHIIGKYFLPSIIFIAISLYRNKFPKKIVAILIAIVFIPFIFYSVVELQNTSYRFQYPMILGLLMGVSLLIYYINDKKIVALLVVFQILFMLLSSIENYLYMLRLPTQQANNIAKELGKITTDASMAVTDAGRLAYYSKWHVVDAWGLNTPKYTKTLIQPEDIKEHNPDLIFMHAVQANYSFLSKLDDMPTFKKKTWQNMCINIAKGIDMNNYQLFMVPYFNYGVVRPLDKVVSPLDEILKFLKKVRANLQGPKRKIKEMPRYDAYFVKKNFNYSKNVQRLLLKHNAITFEKYQILKNK